MTKDIVKDTVDLAKPFLFARDYAEAARVVRESMLRAADDLEYSTASALCSILGTYLSLGGDDIAALDAYLKAEELLPEDSHCKLTTAKHLYFQMHRVGEARERVTSVLQRAEGHDHLLRHKAMALLGRFALAENDHIKALDSLVSAHDEAVAGNVDSIWWDRALVRKLLARDRSSQCQSYLEDLLERTAKDDARQVADEAREMLRAFDSRAADNED